MQFRTLFIILNMALVYGCDQQSVENKAMNMHVANNWAMIVKLWNDDKDAPTIATLDELLDYGRPFYPNQDIQGMKVFRTEERRKKEWRWIGDKKSNVLIESPEGLTPQIRITYDGKVEVVE